MGSCPRYKTRGGWLQGLTPLDSLELVGKMVTFNPFVSHIVEPLTQCVRENAGSRKQAKKLEKGNKRHALESA